MTLPWGARNHHIISYLDGRTHAAADEFQQLSSAMIMHAMAKCAQHHDADDAAVQQRINISQRRKKSYSLTMP
jgi:hypothetical protein